MEKYLDLLAPALSVLAADVSTQQWLDLGCGTGVFTTVLATLLPKGSSILAIDKATAALPAKQGDVTISFRRGDFVNDVFDVPPVDGILMANALHFVRDKESFIRKWEPSFVSTKQWLIVEYDHDTPNQWEPYPINYQNLKQLFARLGYTHIERISERPSIYGGKMYASLLKSN